MIRSECTGSGASHNLSDAQALNGFAVLGDLDVNAQEKVLVLTRGGRLGFASNLTIIDNTCCIFAGVTASFIWTLVKNGLHRLVCECFSQEVMRGQVWNLNIVESLFLVAVVS